MRWFPVSNWVEVYFKCNCFVVTHARCGVCIGDDGGIGGEYEIQNIARFDACWVVYHNYFVIQIR